MVRTQQPTAQSTPASKDRGDPASQLEPIVYWNLCQGIQPFVVESPRLFFAAQALLVVVIVPVVLVLLHIL